MKHNPTHIGEVESVSGNSVTIKMASSYPSNMPIVDGTVYRIGQIGSFLKIPLGYANLYGLITQAGMLAMPEPLLIAYKENPSIVDGHRWLRMILVGEQIGASFERGVLQSPTSGDQVHLVTNEDLRIVYGGYDAQSSIVIGNQSASEGLSAQLDMDKLITRHCAIIGSTGSGKSNAVSIVVKAIAEKPLPSNRILMIDPHGEYASSLSGKCRVFRVEANAKLGEGELCVPFWALPFKELMAIFPGKLSDQNEDYIRSKVLELKRVSATAIGDLREEAITADSPIPFSINQLWFELDNFERTTLKADRITPEDLIVQGDAETLRSNQYPPAGLGTSAPFLNTKAKGILGFLDGMRSRLLDQRYNFLFRPSGYSPDINGMTANDLPQLFSTWFSHGTPISILDLSTIPSNIMQTIAGCILKITYDALYWGQNTLVGGKKQPLLVVLDEAHAYLKSGEDSISSRTVQVIAKEGRKYGVGMLLVTQRPSELDETVLSQCGSIIALRMTNTRDKGHVSSAMQDELREMADVLSSLRTGEAIISGEAVRIPSRIKFFQADNAVKSSDPIPSKLWTNTRPEVEEYNTSVRNWRNQTFN
ncbi:ATP-binding protein [Methylomonas sp. ZR1]|uniref:ATP-binding protein n=1 Tax=Methylomonas sp. ZR1 TaxID=1797072 RepID=UPI001492864D|nr:ATP-binding protein [Methylomonas sp. ZR1]NOV28312.1 ATP-binding protein [Methylomonas sp. ZR1]